MDDEELLNAIEGLRHFLEGRIEAVTNKVKRVWKLLRRLHQQGALARHILREGHDVKRGDGRVAPPDDRHGDLTPGDGDGENPGTYPHIE
jgi:hypothetical protein